MWQRPSAMPDLPAGTRRLTEAEEYWLATMASLSCTAGPYYDTVLQLPFRAIPLQAREAWMIREAVRRGLWDGLELPEADAKWLLGSQEATGRPDAVDEVVPPGSAAGVAGPGQLEH